MVDGTEIRDGTKTTEIKRQYALTSKPIAIGLRRCSVWSAASAIVFYVHYLVVK